MSHEYVILLGGTVVGGGGRAVGSALAWADDTILAIGTDDAVRAISRGDSTFVQLAGAIVIALGPSDPPAWPVAATLEEGGPASFAVLRDDPRDAGELGPDDVLAVVRAGRVVAWRLPGRAPEVPPG